MEIVQCVSCEGYGWFGDDITGEVEDCDWCKGTGYVYRDADGVDHRIPPEDYGRVSAKLEKLDQDRMADMGYTGAAKKPWEQDIREGTVGGMSPEERKNLQDDEK